MKLKVLFISLLFSISSFAGVDLTSTIDRVHLRGDVKLWLKMTNALFDEYCKPGWHGFNIYILDTDPSYPYYYGLITSALSKNQNVMIANISYFNGTTACDVVKTGYGIVVNRNKP